MADSQEPPEIAVDSRFLSGNSDSDYESQTGYETDTTSVKSFVRDYVFENGRRYHKLNEGRYVLPNDEAEQDRLDLKHHFLLSLLDGKLHQAPLKNPHAILDVGTGTGIWAIDASEAYPSAEVIGTDLSPIQPAWVPPNCRFEVDDMELDWTFPRDHFDLVHSRDLGQAIRDWPRYLRHIYRHTKPGGYIQLVESQTDFQADDGSYPENCALRKYCSLLNSALSLMGIPSRGLELEGFARDAGFVDIQFQVFKTPGAPWPSDPKMKKIGQCVLISSETAFNAYGIAALTRAHHMDTKAAAELCDAARRDLLNKKVHVYFNMYYLLARKPVEEE